MLFNDEPGTYYYEGELVPGTLLHKSQGSNSILLGKYSVTEVEGRLFLIQSEYKEEYVGAQMKNGEYQYIFKSFNGEVVIRNEDGEEIYPTDYFFKGLKVKSKNTGKEGHISTIGDELALVKSLDGTPFNSYLKDLSPIVDEVRKSDISIYMAASRNLEQLKPYIFDFIKREDTKLLKSNFDNMMEGLRSKYPHIESKNIPPEPVEEKQGILSKIGSGIKGLFGAKKPQVTVPPPVIPQAPAAPNLNVTSHLGHDYKILPPNATTNGVGSLNHKLTHVDLNPNATGDNNKYLYHYELGQHRDRVASPQFLDEEGQEKDPTSKHLISDGVYLPGEKVKSNGQEYDVVSHINHNPETGTNDYTSILAKNKDGKMISLPKNQVQLSSPDLSNAQKIKLDNGQTKFHHQLQPGDIFTHEGQQHKIMDKLPTKGYISQNMETGKMHFTGTHNFDKEYLSHERPYQAKAGDTIKVPQGVFTIKHIGGVDKNTSLVTAVDKDGTRKYFKMPTDKVGKKVVTKQKFEPLADEEYEKYGIKKPQNVQTEQNNTPTDEMKTPIPEGMDPQKVQEERFKQQTQSIANKLGEGSTTDLGGNSVSHHLGMADVKYNRKLGGISRIENGEFKFGNTKEKPDPTHHFNITDYDDKTHKVTFQQYPTNGKAPLDDDTKRTTKKRTMDLDEFKKFIGEQEKKHLSGKMPETLTAEWKHGGEFKKKALETITKHYSDKGITNPLKEQIGNDTELHKKLQPHLTEYEDSMHAAKTKGSVLRGNREKADIHKQLIKMEAGDDPLHQQIADKIQNTAKVQEKNKKEAQSKLTNTMGQFYHQQGKEPDIDQLKRDIKNPGIHGDDGVAEEHNRNLQNFEKNGGDYEELHKNVQSKIEEKNKIRYDKLDRAISGNPDIQSEEDVKKFLDENKGQYGEDAHEFFTKEEKRRTDLAASEKEKNKAQREEAFKDYKPIFDKETHDTLSKHHNFDKLDTPDIEKHLKNMLDYQKDFGKSKGSGIKNGIKAKAEQESRKLNSLGVVNRFHEGKAYIKNPDAASGESPINLRKEKRAEGFDINNYEVPEQHTKPLSEDEHKEMMHAVDEFTGPDGTGKKSSNLIKLADESKEIPDNVFSKGVTNLKKNENSKEAQIVREHIDKIKTDGVRVHASSSSRYSPEEVKDRLKYRTSGEHAVDKEMLDLKGEFDEKAAFEGLHIDDALEQNNLKDYLGEDKAKRYEELAQKKAELNPSDEIPFGKDIAEPKKNEEKKNDAYSVEEMSDENKHKPDEQLKFNQGSIHEPVRIVADPELIKLISMGGKLNKRTEKNDPNHSPAFLKEAKELGEKLGISAETANRKAKFLAKKHRHESKEQKITIKDLEGFKNIDHDEKLKKSITCTCGESWNNMEKSFHNLYICDSCGNELEKSISPVCISSIAVMCGDEILMGKRRDNQKWGLPGGHVEAMEDPHDAAIRELKEETGIETYKLEKLGNEEEIHSSGKKFIIYPFVHRVKEKPQTTMTDDPDEEVHRWIWKKTPLDEDILNNLHSEKNVTLKNLGLQQWK